MNGRVKGIVTTGADVTGSATPCAAMICRVVVVLSCAAAVSCGTIVAAQSRTSGGDGGVSASTPEPPVVEGNVSTTSEVRLREGMRLSDEPGHFELAAEGLVFVDESGRRLGGLENLNLQRIGRTVRDAEDPASLNWRVSGSITEYEGRNYVLIDRAVYSR